MSRPNISDTRGFSYGVFSGNSCCDLVNDIQSNGISVTQAAFDREVETACEAIKEAVEPGMEITALTAELKRILSSGPFYFDGKTLNDNVEAVLEQLAFDEDEDVTGFSDFPALVEDLKSAAYDDRDGSCEEEEFEWDAGDCKLLLGYLGGGTLIWVIDSSYTTNAAACSPCVPNAGDLDNPRSATGGYPCLCLPPSYYKDYEWEDDKVPEFVQTIDEDGELVGSVIPREEFLK